MFFLLIQEQVCKFKDARRKSFGKPVTRDFKSSMSFRFWTSRSDKIVLKYGLARCVNTQSAFIGNETDLLL